MKLTNDNVQVVNPFSASANGTREKILREHRDARKRAERRDRENHAKFVADLGKDRDWLCAGESDHIPTGKSQRRGGMSCFGIFVAILLMVALAAIIGNIP